MFDSLLDSDSERSVIPAGLSEMEPGIFLGAVLSAIDVDDLSGYDRVVVLAACQRMASHFQARVYEVMVSVANAVGETLAPDVDVELVEGACAAEIRAALHLTRRSADKELAVARGLLTRLPEVWTAFSQGRIDRMRANLIVDQTSQLSEREARKVASQVLDRASLMTTGQLTALLRRLSIDSNPDDARQRFQAAIEQRRVTLEPSVDGTAHLHLFDVPPDRAARVRDRINSMAYSLRIDGETRNIDQLRADVALDLLDPADAPTRHRRGAVTLTVDLATLTGLVEHSGELGGYGPVVSDIARQIADTSHSAEWRFVVTGSEQQAIHVGTTARRPTRRQRRLVESAYPTCVFPGCRIPATQCDLDHHTPWADGGQTTTTNLTPLCRHDHRLRHQTGWTYQRTTRNNHRWVSPLGHCYTTTSARAP